MPFRIAISYDPCDDLPPIGKKYGFVSDLYRQLNVTFKGLGKSTAPILWRDTSTNVEPSEQTRAVIDSNIKSSQCLVVILSRNWVESEECGLDLKAFVQSAALQNSASVEQKLIVVAKNYVEKSKRLKIPQNAANYVAYEFEDPQDNDKAGKEREFFTDRDTDDYDEFVTRLSVDMWTMANEWHKAQNPGAADSSCAKPKQDEQKNPWRPKIYLAQPAPDMRKYYKRLKRELEKRDYAVVPDGSTRIPAESGDAATNFVDTALEGARASIHLIGIDPGYSTGGEGGEPIVKLQLRRAAVRRARDGGVNKLQRIIWAPKEMPGDAVPHFKRDPFKAAEAVDSPVDDAKVDGSEPSSFIDFVVKHLAAIGDEPSPVAPQPPRARLQGGRFFLNYAKVDVDYAAKVAQALRARDANLEVVPTRLTGSRAEVDKYRKTQLQACNAVIVCWACAPDGWTIGQTPQLADWKLLGRERKFDRRALVIGPPPDGQKRVIRATAPGYDVDKVLDLSNEYTVTPEMLDELFDIE